MTGSYLNNQEGPSKSTRAFSLTEVMIASSIAACLITGVALIMSSIGANLQKQKSNNNSMQINESNEAIIKILET